MGMSFESKGIINFRKKALHVLESFLAEKEFLRDKYADTP